MRFFNVEMTRTLASARVVWSAALTPDLSVRAGVDVEAQWTQSDASGLSGSFAPGMLAFGDAKSSVSATGQIDGAYVQVRHHVGPLDTLAGIRADLYSKQPSIVWASVEPRLDERLTLSDRVTARAAVGMFHQPPTLSLNFPTSDIAQLGEGLQWAAHSEVGADVRLPLGIELGVTGFYDPLLHTIEHSVTELLYPSGVAPAESGTAYGVELFVRRQAAGRWFGWISATVQRSERLATVYRFGPDGAVLQQLRANIPSAFDETLVLHGVMGVRLPYGITAGVSVHFNTGRPEDGTISSRTMRVARDPDTGQQYWLPQDLDRVSRLPPYFRADFRVAKLWSFDDWQLEAYLDVMNASLTREVLAYQYSGVGSTLAQTPLDVPIVLPMLGLKGRY
jgi:hypothetical protein